MKRIRVVYVHFSTPELDGDRCTPTPIHCLPDVKPDSGEIGVSLD